MMSDANNRLFSENYLHELPKEIQMCIMDLSKKVYCNIEIRCSKHILHYDKSIISKKLNRKMRKFVYTIYNVEYIDNPNTYKHVVHLYRDILCNYTNKIEFAIQSHINNCIKYHPINYIRDIFLLDDGDNISGYEKYIYEAMIKRSYTFVFTTNLI